jgi:hopanoid biosynthesis associated radical SAM protein HpnH
MSVPVSQMWTVASYVLGKRLRGVERFPLVLMLEPLFRCNLACFGCGKIQHPVETLRRNLSPEECFKAAEECGAPMVAIPGGEPLLHPQIGEIVAGLVARRKYVYLCTNALKLEESLPLFAPSKYLSFSVHLDGQREEHDVAVCREGTYDIAVRAVKAALGKGFRVTINSTLYDTADPERHRQFFDEMMDLGVEGMMVSPGYRYEKAPDQNHFLHREQSLGLLRRMLSAPKRRWKFNQSPLYIEYLKGNWQLECTPWGSPTYNLFGWQKPCYLFDDGYVQSFDELMALTAWDEYGHASGNPKCRDCMMHCGHEPTAVVETFSSWRGFFATTWLSVCGSRWFPMAKPAPQEHQASAGPASQRKPSVELPVLQ